MGRIEKGGEKVCHNLSPSCLPEKARCFEVRAATVWTDNRICGKTGYKKGPAKRPEFVSQSVSFVYTP